MTKQYYLRADIVDTSEQLEQLQAANQEITRRSGIQHNMEIVDRGTSRIVLISIDYDLHASGEYQQRMDQLVRDTLLQIFDRIEEAAYEQMMNSPEGQAAAAQAADFLRGTRH